MPAATRHTAVGDPYVDGILAGLKWTGSSFTFSFPHDPALYGPGYGHGETSVGFATFSPMQQAAAREALTAYASVANVAFVEVSETAYQAATLRFAQSDLLGTAWAYLPSSAAEGGDVWVNASSRAYDVPLKGSYGFTTLLHEIGHALGLDHAHEGIAMPADRDSMEWTVMSYRSYLGQPVSAYTNEVRSFAQSPMIYDIAAIQALYGANYTAQSGDTTYAWSPVTGEMSIDGLGKGAPAGNRIFQTVWDGGGTDTFDFSAYVTGLSIDLRPGHWTRTTATQTAQLHYDGSHPAIGNVANALLYRGDTRSLIENAKGGTGDDIIFGNLAGNMLQGGGGGDVLFGGAGDDILSGGEGIDLALYDGLRRGYEILGDDTVRSVASAAEGADTLLSVETLQFSDGRLVYDLADTAAVVFRMYDSAFDRRPDAPGLNGWITSIQAGMGTDTLASHFAASPEFHIRYGVLDNKGFVEQLYHNVLDREGEAQGVSSWTSALDAGSLIRGQVLAGFSESAEHVQNLAPAVRAGIWDLDETAGMVARLYSAAFDRLPDAGGLKGWTDTAKNGAIAISDMADAFVFSPECLSRYGNTTNEQFVHQLYFNTLDRAPDPQGLANWKGALDSGVLERGEVLLGFSESLEHRLMTSSWMDDGIDFL